MPKLDYLPTGNRNFVIGFMQPPAGYNLDATEAISAKIRDATRKHWARENLNPKMYAPAGQSQPSEIGLIDRVKGWLSPEPDNQQTAPQNGEKKIDRFFFVRF